MENSVSQNIFVPQYRAQFVFVASPTSTKEIEQKDYKQPGSSMK
jgi:hypothetical protein